MRSGFLGRGIGPSAFGGGGRAASWTVTTTGAETHTIAAFTVSALTTVDWGDGSTSDYTGAGARTHDYAGAGTWTVRIMQPLNVTALTLSDNKVTLNSADIASMTNMLAFVATAVKSGTFNSADVAGWNPTTLFRLFSMPAGYAGTWNFADVAHWRPTSSFYIYDNPATFAIALNTASIAAWRVTAFWVYQNDNITATIAAADFAGWTTTTSFLMSDQAFSDAQVNAILYGLYQASIAPRTGVNGTINVGGTNAAPSGTFQACASPPVSAATPGKEIAHELLNDTIGAFANHWATVTITS